VNFFLRDVKLPKTLTEWYTTYPYSHYVDTLEYLYPIVFERHTDNIEFFNGSNQKYFTTSDIDVNTSMPLVNIAYNTDNEYYPSLFLLGTDTTYVVVINNVLVETIYLSRGQWKRYTLDISTNPCSVEVLNNKTVVKFMVTQKNIHTFKTMVMKTQ